MDCILYLSKFLNFYKIRLIQLFYYFPMCISNKYHQQNKKNKQFTNNKSFFLNYYLFIKHNPCYKMNLILL